MPSSYMEPPLHVLQQQQQQQQHTHTHIHNKVCLTKFLILLQSYLLILNHVFIYILFYIFQFRAIKAPQS